VLPIVLEGVSFGYPRGFSLRGLSFTFERSSATAVLGQGSSTLLGLIAGTLRAEAGEISIGTRVVNDLKPSRRPLLFVTSALDVPQRWSVQHALVAAVRQRSLDAIDRQHEYKLAVEKWRLASLVERRIGSLSSSEQTLVQLARIELLKPGILVADRVLEKADITLLPWAADEMYRTLRVMAATVISAPATFIELGFADTVVALSQGTISQTGAPSEVYGNPGSAEIARATGPVNEIPIVIRGKEVSAPIGSWTMETPPFQGNGVALARPHHFSVPPRGEESDFVFSVEEASFTDGSWLARGLLTGGTVLHVKLPGEMRMSKGKLLALRYDASRFALQRGPS
jgi:sn-glycerol 3-phosphate transport system ATP-binding protein